MTVGDKIIHNIHGSGVVKSINGTLLSVLFSNGGLLVVELSECQKPLFS